IIDYILEYLNQWNFFSINNDDPRIKIWPLDVPFSVATAITESDQIHFDVSIFLLIYHYRIEKKK
ncbi:hypothetical protein DERP_000857, partial [Dermatophagoides pteronyssinus]